MLALHPEETNKEKKKEERKKNAFHTLTLSLYDLQHK
jgi:hypothetical protein